ncbi:deoxyribonuclease V [Leptolyngbya sp. AN02str]|uniref:deoxyribonuclease V n=1 Tax=Leptolyngbya sp. AN02str TaxID=3423363 RepID=UPI003D31A210
MQLQHLHPWNLEPQAAIALQKQLCHHIITTDDVGDVRYVAGIDVGFEDQGATTRAAVAVLRFPELTLHEWAIARRPTEFPYIPGLLSFREVPTVLQALEQLQVTPDLLLCDGQGTAHPRRFGIACHVGLLTNLPAVGVGKSLLVGKHAAVPESKGEWVPLIHHNATIGAVLRTRQGTKPLYISPGHRISLETAIAFVLRCTTKYRLPETTRHAHKLASGPAPDQPSVPSAATETQLSLISPDQI